LSLKGKTNEVGTYECRWKNSRGETKHRQFDVSLKFFDEKTDFIIATTVIGLLLIAMGIGIKFYLDKVGNLLIQNADQLTNI
jgi:superfamily II DNA/RNA helicase